MRWFVRFLDDDAGEGAGLGGGVDTATEETAVEAQLARLRAGLSDDGSALRVEGQQPRDDNGRFRSPTAEAAARALEGQPDDDPEEAGQDDGAGADDGAAGAQDTEAAAQDDAGQQPEGEGDDAAGEGEGEGEGSEAVDPRLRVTLRPREPGGEPITITASSVAEADAIRQNIAEGMRREEFNARVSRLTEREATVAAFERLADEDPVSLVLDHIPDKARHVELAINLLADPEVYQAVAERTANWDDPNVRRADAAEMRAARAQRRPQVEREVQRAVAVQRVAQSVTDGIDELAQRVPAELREQFIADATRDMQDHIRRNQVRQPMTAAEVETALAPRCRLYGLTAGSAPGANGTRSSAQQPRPRGPAAERLAAQAGQRNKTGADFVQGARRRRDAASGSPGAGVTHAPPPPAPPKGQGLKERFEYVRGLIGR